MITVERDTLRAAVASASRPLNTRASLPILAGLRLDVDGDTLSLTGTDLDLTMTVRVKATVTGTPATLVVPAALLGRALAAAPAGAVRIDTGDDEVTITAGGRTRLRTLDPLNWPQRLDKVEGDPVHVDDVATLLAAVERVLPAVSNDQARQIICGVNLERNPSGLRLVATGALRMSRYEDIDAALPDDLAPHLRQLAHHAVETAEATADDVKSPGPALDYARVIRALVDHCADQAHHLDAMGVLLDDAGSDYDPEVG